ncbi:putative thiazole-containing bacteriocin maturation protein [Paenibacillus koleovorans]|uniref:putative thiazole-containing bacteriocin maturation protein n=1 Tax=Paenibacillus koleovorans TaxID=121608 RepID=UPI000FDBEA3E|nr:putative thiazole-containing bacteriocin maturation protein [Paenibacillus koleovorans]
MEAAMRLKVNGDTYFVPDSSGGVYFRNNRGSFRMDGSGIDQWIEQLMPMFTGEHTLAELTDGLPEEYRNHVYEIAKVLVGNGYVRDVSGDREHGLPERIVLHYKPQVEYLDSCGGSGAARFESYRQSRVLAAGEGPILVALVGALLDSGLTRFELLVTDRDETNLERVTELVNHAREADPEAEVRVMAAKQGQPEEWRETVRPFDAVLFAAQHEDAEQLRTVHAACRQEGKVLLPAVIRHQTGVAGPLVRPDSAACLESAWRRLDDSVLLRDPEHNTSSPTANGILANVIAFEWLKSAAGVAPPGELDNRLYLLDLEALEGSWHSFLPHPLAGDVEQLALSRLSTEIELENGITLSESERMSATEVDLSTLLGSFGRLTSPITGVFREWGEGELRQLPMCLCRVQSADPLAADRSGAALPPLICAGMTHEEARREAGLAGIEAYAARLADWSGALESRAAGIGAGGTTAEAICRGLAASLNERLAERVKAERERTPVLPVRLTGIEDERCGYYWRTLAIMCGEPEVALGEAVDGFPTVWIGLGGSWFGQAGLNRTTALRGALQQALLKAQEEAWSGGRGIELAAVHVQEARQSIAIQASNDADYPELLRSASAIAGRNGKRIRAFDCAYEPFMQDTLAGVVGVELREEEIG